jgi:hypothetical protein
MHYRISRVAKRLEVNSFNDPTPGDIEAWNDPPR